MRASEGFVMADALTSLMIASLFLTSLLTIGHNSMTSTGRSHNRLVAAYIAHAVLEDPSLHDSTGEFQIEGQTFKWTKTFSHRPSAGMQRVKLLDVGVTVEWRDRNTKVRSIRAHSIRITSPTDAN